MKSDTIVRKWIPPLASHGRTVQSGHWVTVNISACARRVRTWFMCARSDRKLCDRVLDNQFENHCGEEVQAAVIEMVRDDVDFAYMMLHSRRYCNADMIRAAEEAFERTKPAPRVEPDAPLFCVS